MRIAIIGAGATGLTAAWELKKRGYHDVVVFEKDSRAGGKTHSYPYKGEAFDLGSMTFSTSDHTARLAEQFGIPYETVEAKRIYLEKGRSLHPLAYARQKYSFVEILSSYFRFRSLAKKFHSGEMGYRHVLPELCVPFSRFIKQQRLEAITYAAEPAVTGYGYGFYEDVPALYLMKLLESMLGTSFVSTLFLRKSVMCFFPGGWSQVWERMAQQLVVEFDAPVLRLERQGQEWMLWTKKGVDFFDRVILTTSLGHAGEMLDMDLYVRKLFSQVHAYRMVSTLVEGSCALPSGFLVHNTKKGRFGHVQGIECYKPETKCSVLFQVVPWGMSKETIEQYIREDLAVFGCAVKKIVVQKEWEYFYHVPEQALREGFYEELYARQGEQGLFFANSILNFESVQRCQELAIDLVQKFF